VVCVVRKIRKEEVSRRCKGIVDVTQKFSCRWGKCVALNIGAFGSGESEGEGR
jgi:hypothetical protein